MSRSLATLFLGRPLSDRGATGERVGSLQGVAVLGLDALASAAYGPEALLTTLLLFGVESRAVLLPLTSAIVAVLVTVTLSYRQTIAAYPGGGGSFTVAKENLGRRPGVFAASALALDYVLNVAVAIAAGVGAFVSAVPALLRHTLPLCLALLVALTLVNLRGVRAVARIFVFPTYLFVATLGIAIAVGVVKTVLAGGAPSPVDAPPAPRVDLTRPASLWVLMHAFANGCTAMTGVEAVSNGVPIFRKPVTRSAQRTLEIIAAILVVLLLGEAFLARAYGVHATAPGQPGYESILSQLVAAILGRGPFYYVAIGAIVCVLTLSANTSFADFPRLCRLLALDRHLPEPFAHQGRRLVYSHGIVTLALLSALLLVVFHGITDRLIPLFAIGALASFTMSQAGMVAHWRARKQPRAMIMNLAGAIATGVTSVVVVIAKFAEGAWISVLVIGALCVLFSAVYAHERRLDRATALHRPLDLGGIRRPHVVVPIRSWDRAAEKALRFAYVLSRDISVVQVLTHDRHADDLTDGWRALVAEPAEREGLPPPNLVVLPSEFRELFTPLLDFLKTLADREDRQIAVIVPEIVAPRWYHAILHNNTAALLKALLLFKGGPRIVVVDTPWYVDRS